MQPPSGLENLICPHCGELAFEPGWFQTSEWVGSLTIPAHILHSTIPLAGCFTHCTNCVEVIVFAYHLEKPDADRHPLAWARQQEMRQG